MIEFLGCLYVVSFCMLLVLWHFLNFALGLCRVRESEGPWPIRHRDLCTMCVQGVPKDVLLTALQLFRGTTLPATRSSITARRVYSFFDNSWLGHGHTYPSHGARPSIRAEWGQNPHNPFKNLSETTEEGLALLRPLDLRVYVFPVILCSSCNLMYFL